MVFCNLFLKSFVLLVKVLSREIILGGTMREPVQKLIEQYRNNLYSIAFHICQNPEDAEDVVQDTFLKYYTTSKEFENSEHIRAWLIRVAINKAKNITLTFWKRNKVALEDFVETLKFEDDDAQEIFETVMNLPEKLRIVIHLFYYESYSVKEISKILHISESNVKVRLLRARNELKDKLKEGWDHE